MHPCDSRLFSSSLPRVLRNIAKTYRNPDSSSDDFPVWVSEDGTSFPYSGCGQWLIGPATVAAGGFSQPIAFFNPEPREDKWPHQVEKCWQQLSDDGSDGATWQEGPALHIAVAAVADTAADAARMAQKALKVKRNKFRRAGPPPFLSGSRP